MATSCSLQSGGDTDVGSKIGLASLELAKLAIVEPKPLS